MTEFTFKGQITLEGVIFYVKADSMFDALQKAQAGVYDSYDVKQAETVDWDINPNTVEIN